MLNGWPVSTTTLEEHRQKCFHFFNFRRGVVNPNCQEGLLPTWLSDKGTKYMSITWSDCGALFELSIEGDVDISVNHMGYLHPSNLTNHGKKNDDWCEWADCLSLTVGNCVLFWNKPQLCCLAWAIVTLTLLAWRGNQEPRWPYK